MFKGKLILEKLWPFWKNLELEFWRQFKCRLTSTGFFGCATRLIVFCVNTHNMPSRSKTRSQPAQKPAPSKRTNKRFLDDDDMIEDESDSDSYKENVKLKNTEPEDFDEEPKKKKKRPARTGSKSQTLKKTRKDKDSLESVATNEDDQIPHTPQFERAKNICASVKRHLAKPLELAEEEEGKLLSLSFIFYIVILLLFLG